MMLWRANCAISVSTMIATRVRRGLLLKIPTAYDIEKHNISGEPPPVAVKNKKKVVSIEESDKE